MGKKAGSVPHRTFGLIILTSLRIRIENRLLLIISVLYLLYMISKLSVRVFAGPRDKIGMRSSTVYYIWSI